MINLEWVKDYIDISDQDLQELAIKITKSGINIEKVITNKIDNLVIGKVVSCVDHPNSDHLHLCQVEVGLDKPQQIICGAPNIKKNQKVIVALPNAILPGNFIIKKSKIRGLESNGMICALSELGLEENSEGIYVLDDNAPIGKDALDYLGNSNTLYELDIHKHRNNDCYYHIGFAYEISAILNRKVILPPDNFKEIKEQTKDNITIKVETKKCPYYLAKMVKNVRIKESPDFIKKRLASVGMRSINNVVDISNYVMLEYGQPLHFFDKDKLGNTIVVRDALENEKITTLDEIERNLTKDDIVITNGKKAVCIAGVMGGMNTEVDDKTKNILIESAIFDGISIRKTSNRLNLYSEASIRYGKGLNYEYTEKAILRACHLLEKYADATILTGLVKYDNLDKTSKIIEFEANEIEDILGIEINSENIEKELEKLEFKYQRKDNKFKVIIPNRRIDIDPYVNDITEEIARLYGYDKIKSTLPKTSTRGKYNKEVNYGKVISKRLRTLGLDEVKTYTLVSPTLAQEFNYLNKEQVVLPNPMSIDKSVIRTSLIPSLYQVYLYNKARKVNNIAIYEISKTYDKKYNDESLISGLLEGKYINNSWQNNLNVDFYLVKGIVENILNYLGFKNRYVFKKEIVPELHPGISAKIYLDKTLIGIIGRLHPSYSKDDVYVFELSLNKLMTNTKKLKYKEPFKYPSVNKDLSFIVDKNITCEEIKKVIKKAGGHLLTNIEVFDVYTGSKLKENEKSIAYSLTFNDENKTLTEEEVTTLFNKIIKEVETKMNAKLRDN